MLAYENQYDFLDAYNYFQQSVVQRWHLTGISFGTGTAGTQNMMQFGAAVWQVLPPSYHAFKVICAYFGLVGIVLFWRGCCELFGTRDYRFFWLLGLFPSLLFWSTILGKDPLILTGIGAAFYGFARISEAKKWNGLWWLVAGVIVIAVVRPWVAAVFVIALASGSVLASRSAALMIGSLLLGALGVALFWQRIFASFAISQLDDVISLTSFYSKGWAQGGSAITKIPEFHSWQDIALFLPEGAFTALFRPLPGEVPGAFAWLAGFEDLVLLIIVLVALIRVRRWMRMNAVLLSALAFTGGWLITYAPISFQNLGTAARFKMQVLPFVLLMTYLAFVSKPVAKEARTSA